MTHSEIVSRARAEWIREQRAKPTNFLDWVENSLQWWLVIIATTLFLLGAAHTAEIFALITPTFHITSVAINVGFLAPLFLEFGILYAEFEGERAEGNLPLNVVTLRRLLYITSFIVNLFGSLVTVTRIVGSLSALEFVQKLGTFQITVLAGIPIAILAAFIIPIGTAACGNGLARLVLRREKQGDTLERKWDKARAQVIYMALYNHLIDSGTPTVDAQVKAREIASGFLPAQIVRISPPADSPKVALLDSPKSSPQRTNQSAEEAALSALKAGKSVQEIIAQGIAGRSTAYKMQKLHKEQTNGNSVHSSPV